MDIHVHWATRDWLKRIKDDYRRVAYITRYGNVSLAEAENLERSKLIRMAALYEEIIKAENPKPKKKRGP